MLYFIGKPIIAKETNSDRFMMFGLLVQYLSGNMNLTQLRIQADRNHIL